MKIGVLIPYRNDRPRFLEHLKLMLETQTVQPNEVLYVDYKPESDAVDITQRYRRGYATLSERGCTVIFFMEVDDYYSPEYIDTMLKLWAAYGYLNLFGTNYTYYYHLKLRAYFRMDHKFRASAMNTLIRPNLKIDWGLDKNPYTDLQLWRLIKGKSVTPSKIISIGIKHGVGMCGGIAHTDRFNRYKHKDTDLSFLRENMTPESFTFYSTYFDGEQR